MGRGSGTLYIDLIAETAQFHKEMRGAAQRFDASFTAMQSRAAAASRMIGGAMAALAGSAVINQLVQVNRNYDRLQAGLETVTGSSQRAGEEFDRLENFAKRTPFTLDQSVEAYTRLSNLGLDPSERALMSYGNTASSMGKDLMQMIEAVADASTGEMERLKEFGIRANQEGDKVRFTFRGVTTEVGRNSEAIQDYLLKIGETDFAGAMERQMEKLPGKISNLQDSLSGLARAIGEAGFNDLIGGAADMASSFIQGTRAQIEAFAQADQSVSGYINRVQELAEKQAITWREQGELNRITELLGGILPNVIFQIDQYGNAIRLTAGEIKQLRDEQALLVQATEYSTLETRQNLAYQQAMQYREALTEQEKRFAGVTEAIEQYNQTLGKTGDYAAAIAAASGKSAEVGGLAESLRQSGQADMAARGSELLRTMQDWRNRIGENIDATALKLQGARNEIAQYGQDIEEFFIRQKTPAQPDLEAPKNKTVSAQQKPEKESDAAKYYADLLRDRERYQRDNYLLSLTGAAQRIETVRLETAAEINERWESAQKILSNDKTTAAERAQIEAALWDTIYAVHEVGNRRIAQVQAEALREQQENYKQATEKQRAELISTQQAALNVYGQMAGAIREKTAESFAVQQMLLGDQVNQYREVMAKRLEILRESGAAEQQLYQEQAAFESMLNQYRLEEFKRIEQERLLALGGFGDGAAVYFQRLKDDQYSMAEAGYEAMQRVHQAFEGSLGDTFFNILTGRFENLGQVIQQFGESVIRAFADIAARIVAQKIAMLVAEKIFGAGALAATMAEAGATAAAWAPAAAMASLATLGANAGPAAAAVTGTTALATSLALVPFADGGIVTRPTRALIGEAGVDEAVIPLDRRGRDVLREAVGERKRMREERPTVQKILQVTGNTFLDQETLARTMRTIALNAFFEDYANDGPVRALVREGD